MLGPEVPGVPILTGPSSPRRGSLGGRVFSPPRPVGARRVESPWKCRSRPGYSGGDDGEVRVKGKPRSRPFGDGVFLDPNLPDTLIYPWDSGPVAPTRLGPVPRFLSVLVCPVWVSS